jgi:hypothetical protein
MPILDRFWAADVKGFPECCEVGIKCNVYLGEQTPEGEMDCTICSCGCGHKETCVPSRR